MLPHMWQGGCVCMACGQGISQGEGGCGIFGSQQVLLDGHPGGKGFQELTGEGGLACHVCVLNDGEV